MASSWSAGRSSPSSSSERSTCSRCSTTRRSRRASPTCALTLTVIGFAGVAQALVTRVGVRRILPVGLRSSPLARPLRAAARGRPLFLGICSRPSCSAAIGLALSFIPMSIGGARRRPRGRGRRRVGADQHEPADRRRDRRRRRDDDRDDVHEPLRRRAPGSAPVGGAALTYGFQIAFYVLAGWPPSPRCRRR